MRVIEKFLSNEQLAYFQGLPEVLEAEAKLSIQNVVYFSVPIPETIKQSLFNIFGLNLFGVNKVPLRWIKGDTTPHIDRGQTDFDNTYLVYLTDGEGQFVLGDESYPIRAGTAFSFSEGLSHEVTGTQGGSRLLLGPMSESGFAVGGFNIYANGATDTVYIADIAGTVSYKINNDAWQAVPFACYVGNSNADPTNHILKVIFTTDITLTNWNQNFWCGTSGIQFGSESLNADGTRRTITVNNAPLFRGLILNGTSGGGGYNNIYIYNLQVTATGTSTLDDGTYLGAGGWVGGAYFGIGAANNYIVNCSSDGDIRNLGGGIVGEGGGSSGGQLTIRGCSSSGSIGSYAGGIVAHYAGYNNGSVTCEKCWSTGSIGLEAGGIFGDFAGTGGSATAIQCYSEGTIGQDGGGIFGSNGGEGSGSAIAQKCYSRGSIGTGAGGIFGLRAGYTLGSSSASNCYSKGTIATTGNGIFGSEKTNGNASQCYSANGSWSDSTANLNLTGVPGASGVGTTWIRTVSNQPYELNGIGYTPYTTTVINSSSELIQTYSQTIDAGESTVEGLNADASGNDYTILTKSGGDSGSYATITMSVQTGAISTTAATVPGTYTITVRSIGSYNITTFVLTISPDAVPAGSGAGATTACCVTTMDQRGLEYAQINDYRIGNRLLLEVSQNSKTTFDGYSQYVKYKQAQGSRKI